MSDANPKQSGSAGTVPPEVTADAGAGDSSIERITCLETRKLNFFYGANQVLFDISMKVPEKSVTALIGPSGCGKSTFLRTLNRMNDLIEGTRHTGDILLRGEDIFDSSIDVVLLRKHVGMVFQKSTPFPKSIFDNIAYGPRIAGQKEQSGSPGNRRIVSAKSCPLGRSQRSTQRFSPRTVRWSATTTLHRANVWRRIRKSF